MPKDDATTIDSLACARWWVSVVLAVFLWACPPIGTTQAEEMTSYRTGSSDNRVDIVFLGDGYQAHELDLYEQHINGMLDHMFAQQPFNRYEQFFNLHQIDVISEESGADVPPQNEFVDSALGSKYYFDGVTERLLYVNQVLADSVLVRTIPFSDFFVPDMQFVSVNSDRYGGAGGSFATFAGANDDAYEIAVHEVAHSFTNLADEYYFPETVYSGNEPEFANVTTSPEGDKWSHWIGYEQPGIGTIGAFEGGLFHEEGIYRPSLNSKMRSLGQPFDAVAREQLVLSIYNHVDPIDSFSDALEIAESNSIVVDVVDPEVIDLSWFVNGELLDGITAEVLDLNVLSDFGYVAGTYEISVLAEDNTDWVRIQRDELRQELIFASVEFEPTTVEPVGIDALTNAVIEGSTDLRFDLNGDSAIDEGDRAAWVEANQTFFGDADLNGRVDFADFLLLSANFGEDDAAWAQGNFTADRVVNFPDFLFLSGNYGREWSELMPASEPPSMLTASVPEPCGHTVLFAGAMSLMGFLRRTSRRSLR